MRYLKSLVFLLLPLIVLAKNPVYEPGIIVLKLSKGESYSARSLSSNDLDKKLKAFGVKEYEPRFENAASGDIQRILRLKIDPKYDPIGICNALQDHPALEYIEPAYIDQVLETPNDTHYAASLNFVSMQAEAAWDIHKCENGTEPVIIAIVDTGVSWKHPDIVENIWQNLGEDANGNGYTMYHNGSAWVMDPGDLNGIDDDGNGKIDDLIGWNFMADLEGTENNNPADAGSHGTRVAGLAGAHTNNGIGVASLSWNPVLMPISCSPPGHASSVYRGYEAIVYAATAGAKIINCSWGSTGYSRANHDAILYALSLGAIIVAAAGNSNNSIPLYPAAYPGVVAIASLMNSGQKWSGSNYGGYVSAGAPNESVYSTTGAANYNVSTGATSYASPIGAALLALIASQNPTWSNAQIINQLKATCDDVNSLNPGRENLLGGGKINALRALTETEPVLSEHLHLQFFQLLAPSDENENQAIEPGENFALNFTLRNFSDFSAEATLSLSTSSPHAQILQNTHTVSFTADDFVEISDAFEIQISPTAPSGYITFNLNISSATPIYSGASHSFKILVHNGGHFVWEAKAGARNQSGVFIRNALQSMGHQVVYGTDFPASFLSFEAVYLSFGAIDANMARFNQIHQFYAVKNYLEAGGKVYIEGADAVGFDLSYYFPLIDGENDGHEILWPLLGIATAEDGFTHEAVNLQGYGPFNELHYLASAQTVVDYIDSFEALADRAIPAFIEADYGNVAVAAIGASGARSLVFSYALAELNDPLNDSSALDFLQALQSFFHSPDAWLLKESLYIQRDEDEISLFWQPLPFATRYQIFFSDAPGGPFSPGPESIENQISLPASAQKQFFYLKVFTD